MSNLLVQLQEFLICAQEMSRKETGTSNEISRAGISIIIECQLAHTFLA